MHINKPHKFLPHALSVSFWNIYLKREVRAEVSSKFFTATGSLRPLRHLATDPPYVRTLSPALVRELYLREGVALQEKEERTERED